MGITLPGPPPVAAARVLGRSVPSWRVRVGRGTLRYRCSTSLHQRIEHDLYYIQNWSLGLDLRIVIMTLWRGLFNANAY